MYHLATVFPKIRERRLPLSRDQFMLLLLAVNEIILGIDIYLAHNISYTIVPNEWIPIIFGPLAGIGLLIAGWLAFRKRELATWVATLIFAASIFIGLLGSYFHLMRALLQDAPLAQMLSLDLVVWAPPLFGPITFAGVGVIGMIVAWKEDPADSGTLLLPGGGRLRMPFSKSAVVFLLVSLGILGTVLSSVIDHARTGFHNPWLWLPTIVGVFATVVAAVLGTVEEPNRKELSTFLVAMLLMVAAGLIGSWFHLQTDLTANAQFVQERFLRGAPILAPLNFANMAILGLMILLDPGEDR